MAPQDQSTFVMNGGTGIYSYTKNSQYQKEGANAVHQLIKEAISEKLDTKILANASKNRFSLVDLGCSVGPNTFFNMQTIIEAIQTKHNNFLEFQVFFNDHISNDFNTLFSNLPPERRYFAAGAPGSFYHQLFPASSIQFAYSSYSLPWLTRVPGKLVEGTKFQSMGASEEARAAYADQFENDMESFLNARGREIVQGGMMVIVTPGVPDRVDSASIFSAILFNYVESTLVDMMNEGILDETLVHSFNMPVYCPSPKEIGAHVEKNGCFTIERMEMTKPASSKNHDQIGAEKLMMHVRAAFEGVFTKHFGSAVVDDIFQRTLKKSEALSLSLQSAYTGGTELFVVLKRK